MDYVFKANLDLWTFSNGLPTFENVLPVRITAEEPAITLGDLSDDAPIVGQNLLSPEEPFPFLAFDILEFMPAGADAPTVVAAIDYLDFVPRGGATFLGVRVSGPELPRPENGEFIETAYESETEFLTFEDGESVFGAPWGEGEPFDLRDVEGWEYLGRAEVTLLPGTDAEREETAETVALLYETGLDRDGAIDEGELNFWVDEVAKGLTLLELAGAFLGSGELQAAAEAFLGDGTDLGGGGVRDGDLFSNEDYLAFLYDNALDREFDQAGFDFWLGRLEALEARPALASEARETLLLAFSTSPENLAALPVVATLEETLPGIWEFPA